MNLILYNKIKFANCCATIVFKQIQGNLIKKGEDYMPLKIPAELPAYNVLSEENIFVMNIERASHQDIRPLKIGILNLMKVQLYYSFIIAGQCLDNLKSMQELQVILWQIYSRKNQQNLKQDPGD